MPPDTDRLRAVVERLETIDRPPASAGEREAAEWLRGELERLGAPARIEEERATGSFAVPVALLAAVGALAGLTRRARGLAAAAGLGAAAAIADDVSGGPHVFRRLLPRRTTANVVAEAGDPDGAETVVFVAHHDAASGGLVFHPGPNHWVADTFPGWYAKQETSPPLMQLVVAGPALAGLGALLGLRPLRRTGGVAGAARGAGGRRHRPAAGRARRERQPGGGGGADRAGAPAARRAGRGRPRGAALDRQRGVVHGGDARLRRPPRGRPVARPDAVRGARVRRRPRADRARGRGDAVDARLHARGARLARRLRRPGRRARCAATCAPASPPTR